MIKVAIHGANGKLGSRIVSMIEKSNDLSFVGAVNNEVIPECDVVVDVTSDKGITSLIPRLSGEKLIVGTTGILPLNELKKYTEKSTVYVVPNFSEGIQMLYPILEDIISRIDKNWKVEIEETHHTEKKDIPSGTAKRLAEVFKDTDVKIASKREGGVIGIHKIAFITEYEKIEITHEAFSRDLYASGCLKMIRDIVKEPNGYFSF